MIKENSIETERLSQPADPLARRPMPGAISGAVVLIVALVAVGLALSFIGRATDLQAVAMALVVGAVIALAYKYA